MNLSLLPLRRLTAGLPATFWYLWSGTILNRLGMFVVPFLALYLTEVRGVSLSRAALVVSLYGVGAFAANLVGGLLADHAGRRTTMALGLGLGGLLMLGLGFARAYPLIAALTLALGFCTDLYRPAVSAAIADLVPPADRVRAYALMYWAINLGAGVAPLLAGLIASRAYLALFLVDAASTLAYVAIILTRVPETRPVAPAHATALGLRQRVAQVAGEGHLVAFTLLGLMAGCLFFQYLVSLPADMKAHGLSAQDFGVAISVNGLLIVLLSVPVSRLVARFRRLRVMALAGVLIGAGFGLTAWAETLPQYAATVALWTVGELLLLPVAPSVVADLAPAHLRGLYQGVYGSSWGLAALLGPAAGGFVLEHAGPMVLWPGCLALGLATSAGYLLLSAPLERRIAGALVKAGE